MHARQVGIEPLVAPAPDAGGTALPDGRLHLAARFASVIAFGMAIAVYLAAVPAVYRRLASPPEAVRTSLTAHGVSIPAHAYYLTAVQVAFGLACFITAGVIWRQRSGHGVGPSAAFFLSFLGAASPPNVAAIAAAYPRLTFPVALAHWLLVVSLLLFFYLFPDGRFLPRWARFPIALAAIILLVLEVRPGASIDNPSDLEGLILMACLGGGVLAQIHRYRRVSDTAQRQQTKWVIFGAGAAMVIQFIAIAATQSLPTLVPPEFRGTPYDATSITVITLGYLLIPFMIGIAIVRYRLWDIDLIVSRTLLYAALTAMVVAVYVLVVGGAGMLFRTSQNLPLSLTATGIVALIFQPLRDRLQRRINTLVYGERDQPYVVLSRLGTRLEHTLAPDMVVPAIVRTVQEALRLPYVAMALDDDAGPVTVTTAGNPPRSEDELLRLPLAYQGVRLGELRLAPRAPGEGFSTADRRLLDDLARQAGVAVHAVRLAADLQRSRERLVSAREEERRRLRRDLHDGLGPQLAGLTLRLDTVRRLIHSDPVAADAVVRDLTAGSQAMVADIRRLVYGLRPPALDDLGLVSALRRQAETFAEDGLIVRVEAPDRLPPLPAAVEVAAWRIAQEALTNVVRHAKARSVLVRLALDAPGATLDLEILDDGRGLPPAPVHGVGLASMRERTAELGGTYDLRPAPGGGTRVTARLPLTMSSVPITSEAAR
jgi:signal transduction histidine kinase